MKKILLALLCSFAFFAVHSDLSAKALKISCNGPDPECLTVEKGGAEVNVPDGPPVSTVIAQPPFIGPALIVAAGGTYLPNIFLHTVNSTTGLGYIDIDVSLNDANGDTKIYYPDNYVPITNYSAWLAALP